MINGKRVFGVIPARAGSKGVPNKNIKNLGGKPLISYSILEAKKSKYISRFIVSTDSSQIAQISRDFGADVPFLRPEALSTDQAVSVDVVQHALAYVENEQGCVYDYIVLLQPTTPFRSAEMIDTCLEKLDANDVDSVVTMIDVGANHPARMYMIENNRIKSITGESDQMRPRQELPRVFIRSGDVYACKRNTLVSKRSLMGTSTYPVVISDQHNVNLDTELDFIVAEALVKKRT